VRCASTFASFAPGMLYECPPSCMEACMASIRQTRRRLCFPVPSPGCTYAHASAFLCPPQAVHTPPDSPGVATACGLPQARGGGSSSSRRVTQIPSPLPTLTSTRCTPAGRQAARGSRWAPAGLWHTTHHTLAQVFKLTLIGHTQQCGGDLGCLCTLWTFPECIPGVRCGRSLSAFPAYIVDLS